MISQGLSSSLIHVLKKKTGEEQNILSLKKIHGGSINDAFRVETTAGIFFLKINDAAKFPRMFEIEAKGLELLRNAGCIALPAVIATDIVNEKEQYILMEHIHPGSPGKKFQYEFGAALARLHKNSSGQFGLDHDNYIGSLSQSNRQHATWKEFFINERIIPQLKMAIDSGAAEKSLMRSAEILFGKFDGIFPVEKPSLLHGDLWSGNYTCGNTGCAWIFDPAVYYGFREVDLAMTKLFGGFAPEFYSGYNEEFPLENNSVERFHILNLYPLLVHVNLFGGHYIYDVKQILQRFR